MAKNQTQLEDAPEKTFSLISNEKLLAIYASMLKCRMLEQRATTLFQHGKLDSDLHVSAGLEATAAAAVADLQQTDTLCLAPNDWLPAFAKGMSLDALFRSLASSSFNSGNPVQVETEHKNILVPLLEADLQKTLLDRASRASSEKRGAAAAAFIQAGVRSLEAWQKTIQTAGTRKLPIIFVRYSDSADAPCSCQAAKPEALVHGVPSIAVDARDPVAVYRVAYEAIVRARQLRGATLLECILDPPQSSPGNTDPITSDPIAAMESYLKNKNIAPNVDKQEIISSFNRDLDLATRFLDK